MLWVLHYCRATPAATSSAATSNLLPNAPCRGVLDMDTDQRAEHSAPSSMSWITLGTLMLTDFSVSVVASGTISDLRFIG